MIVSVLERLRSKLALRRRRRGYRSRHGGLWPDRPDALGRVERELTAGRLTEAEAESLRRWIADGYVILPGAVPPELADRLWDEVERAWQERDPHLRVELDGTTYPLDAQLRGRRYKLLDLYARSEAAREAAFAPAIHAFLGAIFEREPLLFQSLSFEWASGDPVHQDTAYVVVRSPLEFAAAWIALEDVRPGTGELCYYPGSHRLDEWHFGRGFRNWNRERDGVESRGRYLEGLHERSRRDGLALETFLPRKGDALIWSADLAHGSAPVTRPGVTRKSFVCHYCPIDVEPYYFAHRPDRRRIHALGAGRHWASAHHA